MAKTILVVDDDRTFTTLIEAKLKLEDYNVLVARDGKEGLTMAREQKPSVIILDVMMPGLTGYEFCKHLSDEPELKDTPLLVISSKKSMQDFFPNWMIHGFIHKPFKPEELLEKVADALKYAPAEAASAEDTPKEVAKDGKKEEKKEEKKEAAPAAQAPAPAPAAAAPAPASAAPSSDAPPVLVIGNDEFVNKKIKTSLGEAGHSVVLSMSMEDALEDIAKVAPKFVFCKFHENPSVLDAEAIGKKIQELPATKSSIFMVYCDKSMTGEVAKVFKPAQIISYKKTEEIIQGILAALKNQKVGKAA